MKSAARQVVEPVVGAAEAAKEAIDDVAADRHEYSRIHKAVKETHEKRADDHTRSRA